MAQEKITLGLVVSEAAQSPFLSQDSRSARTRRRWLVLRLGHLKSDSDS